MSFQGSIQELPVPDIIQLVSVSAKTGMFTLVRGAERGYIYLKSGQMVHARVGDLTGEEAIYALAIWNSGDFQFTPNEEAEAATIEKSNTSLLMEAARRLDEWKVLSRKIPGMEFVPRFVRRDVAEPVTLSPLEWNVVIAMDGKRSLAELARVMGTSAFDAAKVVYGLITSGLVEMRSREAGRPAPAPPAPAAAGAGAGAGASPPNPALLGDEKKILMILCTRVKQEAEIAIGEA